MGTAAFDRAWGDEPAKKGTAAFDAAWGSDTPAHSIHDEYASGRLAKRMARENANDQEQAAADDTGYGSRLATHVLNAGQGIPGVEAVEAGAGALGSHLTGRPMGYTQSLQTLRDQTGRIGGKTAVAEKMLGGLAVMPFLPANPVTAGAVLGGADQALAADPESLAMRAAKTVGGAATGAVFGKALRGVGNVAQRTGVTDAMGAGLSKAATAVGQRFPELANRASSIAEAIGTKGAGNRLLADRQAIQDELSGSEQSASQAMIDHIEHYKGQAKTLYGAAKQDTKVVTDPRVQAVLQDPRVQQMLQVSRERLGMQSAPTVLQEGIAGVKAEAPPVLKAPRTGSGRVTGDLKSVPDEDLEAEIQRLQELQGKDEAFVSGHTEHPDYEAAQDLRASGDHEDAAGLLAPGTHQKVQMVRVQAAQRQKSLDKLLAEARRRESDLSGLAHGDHGDTSFGFGANAIDRPAVPPALLDLSQYHVDPGLHSRLLNTPDGTEIGTLGSYLKGAKVRALFSDVLDTPIMKLSAPPGGAPATAEFKGAFGDYGGRPTIFLPAQSHTEFVPSLLEEAAHAMRASRGRVDVPQQLGAGFDFDAYRALPAEQSAEKMVRHALSLRDDVPAVHTATGRVDLPTPEELAMTKRLLGQVVQQKFNAPQGISGAEAAQLQPLLDELRSSLHDASPAWKQADQFYAQAKNFETAYQKAFGVTQKAGANSIDPSKLKTPEAITAWVNRAQGTPTGLARASGQQAGTAGRLNEALRGAPLGTDIAETLKGANGVFQPSPAAANLRRPAFANDDAAQAFASTIGAMTTKGEQQAASFGPQSVSPLKPWQALTPQNPLATPQGAQLRAELAAALGDPAKATALRAQLSRSSEGMAFLRSLLTGSMASANGAMQ